MAGDGPSRLAIRTPNWLGDAIMALPAMAAIRRAYPAASLAVVAPAGIAPIFEEHTAVAPQQVIRVGAGADERALLAGERFDAILLLPNSFRSAWIARGAGISERWGYANGPRRWVLTRTIPRPGGRLHQSDYYLRLAAAVTGRDASAPDPAPLISATDETVRRGSAALERLGVPPGARLVGFAPGAAYGHAKRWPPDRIAAVIERLGRDGVGSILVGAEGDRGAGREIESALPPGVTVTNLIGRTDLRLLAGVLARCDAFVSNDSGAMHLAAALGVPVAAIFGPTDERATAPLGEADVLHTDVFCRPCMLRDCPIDHRCMTRISVDAVYGAVRQRLDRASLRQERA
jgi:heptosyltransferase-2